MSGDILSCPIGEEAGDFYWLEWVESRDATKISIMQGIGRSPTTKNYPTQNVNSAEVEKPYSKPLLDNQTKL